MTTFHFLTFLPSFSLICIYIYNYLSLNFKNTFNSKNKTQLFFNNYSESLVIFKMQLILFFILKFFCFKPTLISSNYFKITEISYLYELLLIFFFYLFISSLNLKFFKNEHWTAGICLTFLTTTLLVHANDLFMLYILIELNAYLFIFISLAQIHVLSKNQQKSITLSITVNFILNFYSSFLFFCALSYLFYTTGNFIFLLTFNKTAQILFFFFLLLKISLGPWLYFGGIVYSGFQLPTLLFYSFIYLFGLFPKLVELFLIFSTYELSVLFISVSIMYVFYILSTLDYIKSLKIFLAYSTSIFSSYILFILSFIYVFTI